MGRARTLLGQQGMGRARILLGQQGMGRARTLLGQQGMGRARTLPGLQDTTLASPTRGPCCHAKSQGTLTTLGRSQLTFHHPQTLLGGGQ